MEDMESREASGEVLPEQSDSPDRLRIRSLFTGASILAGASLTACGGGTDDPYLRASAVSGNGDESASPGGQPETAAQPTRSGVIDAQAKAPDPTPRRASRFLQHASMGATDDEIQRAMALGFEGWLDEQRDKPGNGLRWDYMFSRGYGDYSFRNDVIGVDGALWWKMITSPDTLRQRVTLALTEIFVINPTSLSNAGEWPGLGAVHYVDGLENLALGNYRDLLEYVTLSMPMGFFLSLSNSKKADASGRAPDENYAREVMQLFSIGLHELNPDGSVRRNADGSAIETYTQEDVSGVARALTGWQRAGEANSTDKWQRLLMHHAPDHEQGEKTFLGTTIPAGTDGPTSLRLTLDHIANHPNVGPFLGRQLIQRLVTSNPTPEYTQRVAAVWANNGQGVRGDLFAVVKAILLDPEALADETLGFDDFGKVREPIMRFAQWARTFGATDGSNDYRIPDLSDPADHLGQSPLRAPSVFNFFRPGFVPGNTTLGARGKVAPELQITSEASIAGYVNFMTDVIANGAFGLNPNYFREQALAGDPAALVSRVSQMLTADQLSAETVQIIVNTVAGMPSDSDEQRRARVHAAVLMTMVSPDYLVQK